MLRRVLILLLSSLSICTFAVRAETPVRVVVAENSPPMSYRNESGELVGFSVDLAKALCAEMRVECTIGGTTFTEIIDALASGRAEIGASGMLDTPARRAKMLYSKPVYRSTSIWVGRPGVPPGQAGVRVGVVGGSAQEAYARAKGWDTLPVRTNGDLVAPLVSGQAQAILAPMLTVVPFGRIPAYQELNLVPTVIHDPILTNDAHFGISPLRPDLRDALDGALDRIKRNGVFDRINSRYLPFRII